MNALQEKIISVKKERDTIILSHYYQPLEVQDVSDRVGDSFNLAQLAQSAAESAIILCGVRFMAESAKILNPGKTVYLPSPGAGCPMADMVTPEDVLSLRSEYPTAAVVCYVNSSAAVKAVSDVCCTSSSAVRIVKALPEKQIIFVPDQNLGAYVAAQVPEKELILFSGNCPIHHAALAGDVAAARSAHGGALLLVHPECRPEVSERADYVGSTAGILDFARKSGAAEFIIGTEIGVLEILRREFPEKKFHLLHGGFICEDMKKTRLEDILGCFENKVMPIELPEDEMRGARQSLERMINA